LATVQTVTGPLDVEELGLTLIHEHFRVTDEACRAQFPHLYDEEREWKTAISDANASGGTA
jgi:phosphotriesterase-related protein